ncbi:MAG: tetratricopeptide repeat protein [Treponema sp.]|nr:tetratricopeptide repeat protein [Treponema sp.]
MFGFLKKLFSRSISREYLTDTDDFVHEQWEADFSREDEPGKPPHVRFSITSENLYRAYLFNNALCLGVKKTGCIAWAENAIYRYQDMDIKGHIRLDPKGGYAAAGFIFRMVDDLTYYMALVSSRGYFRLDLVRNSVPFTLAGWTEVPGKVDLKGRSGEFKLRIITFGSKILLLINEMWAGAWDDPSIPEGRIAFVTASYEETEALPAGNITSEFSATNDASAVPEKFSALAELVEFSLDSYIENVHKHYYELEATAFPDSRIRLAETFTALGRADSALAQLRKAWEYRANLADELAKAEDGVVLAAIRLEESIRSAKELLLGARLALALELWDEAEEYIEEAMDIKGIEQEARSMKTALLYSSSRYDDLIHFAEEISKSDNSEKTIIFDKIDNHFAAPASFFNLLGHCYFNKRDYQKAADAYDHSFKLDETNGFAAKNAAAAYELLEQKGEPIYKEKTLDRYLKAGRVFLADNRYEELGLIIPKFRLLGENNWEGRALAGKWAFGIENWITARKELDVAEQLRKSKKGARPDPAIYFLQALLLVREGKRREAMPLFEKAVKLEADYPLFRFRLAENRFLINNDPGDPELAVDLEIALKVTEDDRSFGWIHNFAAQAALSKTDTEKARVHLEKAAVVLGEVPAVRVNKAVFLYLHGNEAEALRLLESRPEEDPEGLMANCAGNLLVRSRRFEEADVWYRRALAVAPFNIQYRYNRGSCLIELGHYGEADDVLTAGLQSNRFSPETSPDMLGLIAFVAVKKGEHKRAEAALRAALKINPNHAGSLLQLGWNRAFASQWEEVEAILDRLDEFNLSEETEKGRDDLEKWMIDALYKTVSCTSCNREWQVERNPKTVTSLRLYAIPPDDMPGGTCPKCGNTYCVGCRKDALDESGRFVCPDCGKTLKLTDDGLKALLNDWAKKNVKKKRNRKSEELDTGNDKEKKTEPEEDIAGEQENKPILNE